MNLLMCTWRSGTIEVANAREGKKPKCSVEEAKKCNTEEKLRNERGKWLCARTKNER